MHLLLFLEQPFKLLTPNDVDTVISAQWPDPESEPLLFSIVKSCMVHGPCGAFNPSAPCMEDGKCTKYYPKPFQEHTTMDQHGYPLYARPDDGRQYEVRGKMLDNRWIVPYNPASLARFNCHFNAECAVTFRSVKYINKYIHKGGDRTTFSLEQRDEIGQFVDARYVSPPEGIWRILANEIHVQVPSVCRLQIHLPGQHMTTYDPNEDLDTIIQRAASERTTLTEFFRTNAKAGAIGALARQYTYQEFPQYFVWKKTKEWSERQQNRQIGRMYYVGPTAGERFYLRTLLTVVKGPRSFEDLRSYNGVLYPTFREACLMRGLLADDGEWRQCLAEASHMQTGKQLRQLFATILLFCEPAEPARLWDDFRYHICDDLEYRLTTLGHAQPSEEDIYDYGLYLLDGLLRQSGRALSTFAMPLPSQNWDIQVGNPRIVEQLSYDCEEERLLAAQRIPAFNSNQLASFDEIMASVRDETGGLFFLNGPGGTGKTFVYNTICHEVRSHGWIALCVASSGIASLLLRGGRTAHSTFKIPVEDLNEESFCPIPKEGDLAGMLRLTRIINWDEITMQHRYAPEAVDRTLRDIRNCDKPFGGITVVFGGDFQQILPVVEKGSPQDIIAACIQRSYLWPLIKTVRLTQNMRLETNPGAAGFARWLLDVGHGRDVSNSDGTIALRPNMTVTGSQDLITSIYTNVGSDPPPPPLYFSNRMILAARNGDVDKMNEDILDEMAGESRMYYSADKVISEAGAYIPIEAHNE